MKKAAFFLIAAFVLLSFSARAAETVSLQNYRRAFAEIDAGHPLQAANLAAHTRDNVLSKVITGYAMALPGNDYSFDEMASFVLANPDWPGLKGILMIAEQKFPQNATPQQVINWFDGRPPTTLVGFYRYMDALDTAGQARKARDQIRARWIERDFSENELLAFHSRYAPLLSSRDHVARLDRLLWANEITDARRMYRFINADMQALAEARIALANQLSNAENLVARVPSSLRDDAGLLWERLRWRRKSNLDDGAVEILDRAPKELRNPEAWWDERHIQVRRAMEKRDFNLAYKLASNHGLIAGPDFVEAEFLCGWLALRFFNRADLAHTHFENLLQSATTPISRARGFYWLGRTQEVLGEKKEAQQSYETAATLRTTFYGQLATARLYDKPTLAMPHEPPVPEDVRKNFMESDLTQAIFRLDRLGYSDRAYSFFRAAMDAATRRVDFALLAEVAYQIKRPDWAIKAAKTANQKNMVFAANAYPTLGMHLPSPPHPAFTHALIRQESLFNADAGSVAGARGLMQLMPKTAQSVAKKLGMKYSPQRLTDPDYNVRLGTTYFQGLIDQYDGSYVLALAAYNAGSGRVRTWINLFGDPRSESIDSIDWIELIPIYETRNYVQRVMENFEIYKARLNGGKTPLTILRDIRK